jgi:hypothetical protein
MQPSFSSDGQSNTELSDLSRIAQDLNTHGVVDAQSRALIVFNVSRAPVSHTAQFISEVTWDKDTEFPGVVVTTWDGEPVASEVLDLEREADRKGREDKVRLKFKLNFTVEDLATRSWRTYIARFGTGEDTDPLIFLAGPSAGAHPHFVVLEAAAQQGELGPTGTL